MKVSLVTLTLTVASCVASTLLALQRESKQSQRLFGVRAASPMLPADMMILCTHME